MSVFRLAATVSVLMAFLLGGLLGCAPAQTGGRHATLAADPEHADPGPFPMAFRDIVIEHIADAYPGDQVLRNIVVRPPMEGVVPVQGVNQAGFIGLVRMSLKDDQRQAYVPVEYCYFLREDRILVFMDAGEAEWCAP